MKDLICVAITTSDEAEKMQQALEAAGIQSKVKGSAGLGLTSIMRTLGALVLSPVSAESVVDNDMVQVLVHDSDAEQALQILEDR